MAVQDCIDKPNQEGGVRVCSAVGNHCQNQRVVGHCLQEIYEEPGREKKVNLARIRFVEDEEVQVEERPQEPDQLSQGQLYSGVRSLVARSRQC